MIQGSTQYQIYKKNPEGALEVFEAPDADASRDPGA
jgi:hypothetical protein